MGLYRIVCDMKMMTALSTRPLPQFPAAAPPSDIAMTACAKSRKIFCAGAASIVHKTYTTTSNTRTVKSDGEPPCAWNISWSEGSAEIEVPVVGGTMVRVVKRKLTIVRTVGGSWSRMIRMARTSRRGHADRMVVATVSKLLGCWMEELFTALHPALRGTSADVGDSRAPFARPQRSLSWPSWDVSEEVRARPSVDLAGGAACISTCARGCVRSSGVAGNVIGNSFRSSAVSGGV